MYANIAPVSWLVQRDVEEGREHLNFSEWHRPQDDAQEAAEVLLEREMPLLFYRMAHADARLTDSERERLARGLEATFAGEMANSESQ